MLTGRDGDAGSAGQGSVCGEGARQADESEDESSPEQQRLALEHAVQNSGEADHKFWRVFDGEGELEAERGRDEEGCETC